MIHQCLSDILNLKRLPLGELGFFYGGLSGKSKEDFEDGNGRFVPYMNVFSNFSVDINNLGEVNVEEDEHQNKIEYGDVLFTGSSETPDECGMSSVMLDKVEDDSPIYLNSFCFGFRFNDLSQIYPAFYKHLFRSNKIRKEIGKTANGVTRFNITKKLFAKILIPLPSLEQQKEIAAKLDIYTSLISRLDEEIDLRKKQFEYYRGFFFRNLGSSVLLREVAKIMNGKDYKSKDLGNIPVYGSGGVMTFIDSSLYDGPSVLLPRKGSVEKIYYVDSPFWTVDTIYWTIIDSKLIMPKFLYYALLNYNLKNYALEGGIPSLTQNILYRLQIPLTTIATQQTIVEKLDVFTSLITKLQEERDLRQKQYEYYREKLLTFE